MKSKNKKLPSLDDRKKSIFFKAVCSMFKMSGNTDYHWNMYLMVRCAFLISTASLLIFTYRLLNQEFISVEYVSSEIQIFTIIPALIITVVSIPYHYLKCRRDFGVHKIDYFQALRETTKEKKEYGVKQVPKMPWVILALVVGAFLFWFPMRDILIYYNVVDDKLVITLFMTGYLYIYTSLIYSPVIVHVLLIYVQYTHFLDQVPSSYNPNNKE